MAARGKAKAGRARIETDAEHVYKPEDVIGLTHWLGSSWPWDAP